MKSVAWLLLPMACAQTQEPPRKARPEFPVRVVYLYPADQERFPEYERAIKRCVDEVTTWFHQKTGLAFQTLPLEIIKAQEDYITMRCGRDAAERALGERNRMYMPRWIDSIEHAVGGWRPRTVTWVFAQGGGGIALGNLQGDFAGFGVVGDWVLEPISGRANPKGIAVDMCTEKTYVTGGTPVGTTMHELGHAFGLHHPDEYAPREKSIMLAHWTYPNTSFLDHELLVLRHSPFIAQKAGDKDAPFVDYATADAAEWERELVVQGRGFRDGDEVELVDVQGSRRVRPLAASPHRLKITVPRDVGPGLVRVRRGPSSSNAVPLNVYEKRP